MFGRSYKDIIEHKLDIDPTFKSKKHKLRKLAKDRTQATKAKVQRLLDAKVIREVQFTMAASDSSQWMWLGVRKGPQGHDGNTGLILVARQEWQGRT